MADLTFRSNVTGGDGSLSASSIVAALPPDTRVGDLLTIWCSTGVLAPAAPPDFNTPSGWTLVGSSGAFAVSGGALNAKLFLFAKVSDGTEGAVTLQTVGPTNAAMTYSRSSRYNVNPANPFPQVSWISGTGGPSTSAVVSGITTGADRAEIEVFLAQGSAQNATPPGSMTERSDFGANGISTADELIPTAGATGTRTFSLPGSADFLWGIAEYRSELPAVTLVGPVLGRDGVQSSDFTVGANHTISGTVVVTPSDGGAGGTFSPSSVSISAGSPTGTFRYTPPSGAATRTISVTNGSGLVNPSSIAFVVQGSTDPKNPRNLFWDRRVRTANLTRGSTSEVSTALEAWIFGATVSSGPQTVTCTGIASAEAFGTAKINRNITATGIASAEAFGTPKIGFRILATGIASAEAFGTAKVNLKILAVGIASSEAFGSASVSLSGGPQTVTAVGIASAEAFGTARINLKVSPTGIASGEQFGTPKLNLKITLTGIASAEAFGTARLNLQVKPAGIATAEAFGTPNVGYRITVNGIASAEAFGLPKINLRIAALGIPSGEAFGTPTVTLAGGAQTITCVGIASGEAFGSAQVQLVVTAQPDTSGRGGGGLGFFAFDTREGARVVDEALEAYQREITPARLTPPATEQAGPGGSARAPGEAAFVPGPDLPPARTPRERLDLEPLRELVRARLEQQREKRALEQAQEQERVAREEAQRQADQAIADAQERAKQEVFKAAMLAAVMLLED